MWELGQKEGWVLKNWRFQTKLLEKTLESPLDCKKIEPVNPKGNQPWIFIGRTDAETEAPILWPCDAKSWFTEKKNTLMLRKIEGRKRRGRQRMKWFGSHHWLIVDMSLSKLKEIVKDRVAWCAAVHVLQRLRHDLVTEQWQQFAFCVLLACTYHPLSTSLLYSTTWCSSLHLYFPCSILDRSFI